MGIMDDMQDSGNIDGMKSRYDELRKKEQSNELDDRGREELDSLREKLGN